MGISVSSRVQEFVIPKLIGNPHICYSLIASQGTGKTLAYLIPVLKRIDSTKGITQAICLVYSSELAYQTANVAARLAIYLNKRIKIGVAIADNKGKVICSN